MHLLIEKIMRGGISYIAKIFSNATNKYMQFYNGKKPSKNISYLDANNLYGWTTRHYLPHGRFKWLIKKWYDKVCLFSVGENSSTGS